MKYLAFFDHHGAISGLQDVSDWTDKEIQTAIETNKDFGKKTAIVTSLKELKVRLDEADYH